MNERLIVKSFGPVKDLDIVFKSVTIFVGDQGTGKSCVAKLFSMFKWLEKALVMQRQKLSYYEQYNRFSTMLCKYHRIESFLNEETYIRFEGEKYVFEYDNLKFHINDTGRAITSLSKIIYIPAERTILSVAENAANPIDTNKTAATSILNVIIFFCYTQLCKWIERTALGNF